MVCITPPRDSISAAISCLSLLWGPQLVLTEGWVGLRPEPQVELAGEPCSPVVTVASGGG